MVSLTPGLSCISSAGEGDDRKALYAAFFSGLDLLRCIDEDAKKTLGQLSSIQRVDHKFPYISSLPKHDKPQEYVHFKIIGLHSDQQTYRLLYVAELLGENKGQILIKFTHRYSIELHAFCAKHGRAPRIHGFGSLPGGWFAVAMDYISTGLHPPQVLDLTTALIEKWATQLTTIMQSFHNEQLVHGDLRGPNIICHGEDLDVMLIDFDWGGKVGKAKYPQARLCAELIDGRNDTDPKITKGDDERVLKNTIEQLKRRSTVASNVAS